MAKTVESLPHTLIEKYDVPGPRYTSYPTALQFSESFGADDFKSEAMRARRNTIEPLSLYVHIPFCRDICYYCACNKVVSRDPQQTREYLDHLRLEMRLLAPLFDRHRQVQQLHLGGGTPTFLSHAELTELMHRLATHFSLVDNEHREYSIEIDPRSVTTESIALLKGLGFNRLSFGVQDVDAKVQRAVNRLQSLDTIRKLTEAARHFGFASVSYDLIYGLPFQSELTLQHTADTIIALGPDRIACYNYAHLPDRFPSQRAIDRLTLPSSSEKLRMLVLLNHAFTSAGYRHIGMDHFVRPTDDLATAQDSGRLQRNFQGYSTVKSHDLIGLGVSAISSLPHCYSQNDKTLSGYYQRLDRSELPVQRGLKLTRDDEIRREVIMQLMCHCQLDLRAFEARHGLVFSDYFFREAPQLQAMVEDGLLEWGEQILLITPSGRALLRNIAMVFDAYLTDTSPEKYSKAL